MAKKSTKKSSTGHNAIKKVATKGRGPEVPFVAPDSPEKYRVRVRMHRHGLGDCFLITFPREGKAPFQILIDCGALNRTAKDMQDLVGFVRDSILHESGKLKDSGARARLDVVVGTHEHKDHLSGFNAARDIFNKDFDIGAVWLGWTENLTKPEIKKIKETKKKAVAKLRAALDGSLPKAAVDRLDGVESLLAFSEDDDTSENGRIADALDYLKLRGKAAGSELLYLDPGSEPLELDGVDGVRVFVLGPPHDPQLLKGSEVTEQMKKDGVIYHLAATGEAGMEALSAAIPSPDHSPDGDRYQPFSPEHRIVNSVKIKDPFDPKRTIVNPYYKCIKDFAKTTYDDPAQEWRRIDHDWLNAFGQLALDLDNDTNNTSLVLAFEFIKTREVLLFVGDAQAGNWLSWANLSFKVPDRSTPLKAHDLLRQTVFYKVGHHCSHNATLKKGGLELMLHDDLVSFIPLDRETAKKQGRKDPITQIPKGWDMPAGPLYKALKQRSAQRVVVSDKNDALSPEAQAAGIRATEFFVDYFLT